MTWSELSLLMKKSPEIGQKAVYDEYYNYVFTIVFNRLRSCASNEDMEECVSDIFADLFIEFDSDFEYVGDLKAYINTVAKNKTTDMYRHINAKKNSYSKLSDIELDKLPSDMNITEKIENKELQRIVFDIIRKLGEPDSSILILKYYYGRTSSEIGKKLSISAASVRKRAERALKRLKKILSDSNIKL